MPANEYENMIQDIDVDAGRPPLPPFTASYLAQCTPNQRLRMVDHDRWSGVSFHLVHDEPGEDW